MCRCDKIWRQMLAAGLCFMSTVGHAMVEYSIEITHAAQHLARVRVTFPEFEQTEVDVRMPVWRTGKYKILNFSAGVGEIQAFTQSGKALSVRKTDKSSWRVQLGKPQPFHFEYELYADQLGARTRHIDETHAFLDAASVFVYVEALRQQPVTVLLLVPADWRSRSGMQAIGEQRFGARNYDELVDSPIESGLHAFHRFEAGGKPHELVIWGQGNQDEQQIISDLQKISAMAGVLWGSYPFERYVWMLHLTAGIRGATEHVNSTIIQTDRFKFSPRKDYLDFLVTAAHEFIHTWNVKAYRPVGLVPYDYQQENYTSLLWMAEGSTSYLAPLLLARAGVIDAKEFLNIWTKALQRHVQRPGHARQSPADASFDAWLDESPHWDQNAKADIYIQGMMVSWLLDMTILEKTGFKQDYARVHRLLYERHPLSSGAYDEQDVLALLNEVAGTNMHPQWQAHIDGVQQWNIEDMLSKLGLRVQYGEKSKHKNQNPDVSLLWSGIHLQDNSEDAVVARVERDSPAWQAGLTAGDVMIAIDGYRISRESWGKRLKDYHANKRFTINFFRQGILRSAELQLQARSGEELKLLPMAKANKTQQAYFKAWSGLNWATLQEK